ncbi:MAG: iron ABC transporter permease [Anaerolineae bacterium]|nr:iron ABC transporter permease [Anaerolineae bacterium]
MGRSRFAVKFNTRQIWHGLWLVPVLFLLIFYFYPLGTIFDTSLLPGGQLDLSGFVEIVSTSYYREIIWFTFYQAVISTVFTLLLALPAAYVFARFRFPGKSLLLSLSTLAFVLPTIVVAAAFRALIGPQGLVNQTLMSLFSFSSPPVQLERTFAIIVIVHVFYNYAVALRIISGYWINQGPRIEEAARVLGASGWRLWYSVRLPMLRPAILAAAALVFIFTFTSFGVILILGGVRFATLEVEIYRQTANFGNLPLAAALSIAQILIMLVLLLFYTRLQRSTTVDWQQASILARPPRKLREKVIVSINVLIMLVLLFTPLVALILSSLTVDGELSLQYYRSLSMNDRSSVLFVPPVRAIGNSLIFALTTTVLSTVLGLMAAYLLSRRGSRLARWLDPIFMLPLATSAVTLGFGFIIALDEPPLNLRTSPILIPLAHSLVAMPFVVRSVLPALNAIKPNIREAAQVLGAPAWREWIAIDLPLISRGVAVAATFAFTISMGEFGASIFVARPDTPTMPVVIYRLLSQPGGVNYGQALAMSVILMLVCGVSFVLIERVREIGVGEL